jgi:colicin import membrane protein
MARSLNYPGLTDNTMGMLVSGVLHGLIIAVLIVGWSPAEKEKKVASPRFIEAKLLQMQPAAVRPAPPKPAPAPAPKPAPKPEPVAKPEPKPEPKVDEEQQRKELERQQQLKQEQQRQEQLKKEQAEKQRQEQLKKEQAEKQRQEQLKREQAEKQRQEQLKREQAEKQRQQELAQALAMEEAMLADEEFEAQVGTYVDYMASLIAANWSRPPSARLGMVVELEISLGSGGRVDGVRTIRSSGNAAFDRSAEQAVFKVGQFSRLREMDPTLYQRQFRKVRIVVNPQDLRM